MRRAWSDGKRLSKKEGGYDWLYHTARWRKRRLQQLRTFPLCAACLQNNHVKAATVAHHLEDHRGDYNLFFNSPLESLCKQCHDNIINGSKHFGYQRGCDINGKPYKTKPIYIDHNKAKATTSTNRKPWGSCKCSIAGRSLSGVQFLRELVLMISCYEPSGRHLWD